MDNNLSLIRPETPRRDTQSDDELNCSPTGFKSTARSQLSARRPLQATGPKKRKNTSPLKQSERFISSVDPIKSLERAAEMLMEARDQMDEENGELVAKAITLVSHVLNNTLPEPMEESPLEKTIAEFTKSFNDVSIRLGRVENSLAAGVSISPQTSSAGSNATRANDNMSNGSSAAGSWATAASFKGPTNERTNNGFVTVQYPLRSQQKASMGRSFTDQRAILIGCQNTEWQKDVKATRDRLNETLKARLHTQHPVIASITKAQYSENTVLVATQHFTAQDIVNNADIIQSTFGYERIQKDVQWFKTMVHGIAISDFDTATGMQDLQKEVELYNPRLQLATLPRWVTTRESRAGKMHGSVVLSFDNEEMHQMSLRGKLFIGGASCHTRNFRETKPTDWCVNCQSYGHTAPICHKASRCLYCQEDHPTIQHRCGACRANKGCEHVKCINCGGDHAANDKKCGEWQTVLAKQYRNRTRANRASEPMGSQSHTEITRGENHPYRQW